MVEKNSVFDIIGPVMIGPSSSHTAGVVRIALTALAIFKGSPKEVIVTFYNSFARTYQGHGSDKAAIAGLLGYGVDDERINKALEKAKKKFNYRFISVDNASSYHPNTVRITLKNGNKKLEILGVSTGGGLVNIIEIDGFRAGFSTSSPTLIVYAKDVEGSIAFIASILANEPCNIATMSVSRKGKHERACLVVEIDSQVKKITLTYLKHLYWVHDAIYLPTI